MTTSFKDPLTVCSWSLQPTSPQQLIEHLRAIGLSRVQLALDPLRENPAVWSEEIPSGTGQVDWKQFFAVLREIGFNGHCCIEGEAGTQRVADIITARKMAEEVGN